MSSLSQKTPNVNVQRPTPNRSPITDHQSRAPILHRLALRALRSRHSSADAGTFQFQQSAWRLSGMPRLRSHHCDRPESARFLTARLSIAQGVVRVFRGQELGESQKDLLRACAREEIDVNRAFRGIARRPIRISSSTARNAAANTRTTITRTIAGTASAAFSAGSRSRLTKCTCACLLSRYRAYIKCPSCNGGRYQPEALNYKTAAAVCDRRNGRSSPPAALPFQSSLRLSDCRRARFPDETSSSPPDDSTAEMLRDEICARLRYLCEVGVGYLTLDRSHAHA